MTIGVNQWISITLVGIKFSFLPLYIDLSISVDIKIYWLSILGRAWHMVKYLLGYWIIFWTAFLDHFFFVVFFLQSISTQKGWEADFCYWGRSRGRTISTQEGGGRECISKCYWLMEFLMGHKNCFEWFFHRLFLCQKFCAGSWRFFIFCHANAKLVP